MKGLFDICFSLSYLPDLSKWDLTNAIDLSYLFNDCSSLKYLPDISNWKLNNVRNMSFLFAGCSSLKYLPDISKWNISNVINMSNLFYNCSSLVELPDITKWNINNVIYLNNIYYGCSSLIKIPYLIRNQKNENDINYSSLSSSSEDLFDKYFQSLPNKIGLYPNNENFIKIFKNKLPKSFSNLKAINYINNIFDDNNSSINDSYYETFYD